MARKYGMPYKGSKNAIAEKLIEVLPPAEHFYDLFGGGGAMTHCAVMSGKYKHVHYNELDPLVFKGFKMAINGEFKHENRWISREDFERLKDSDPYVAICFSFGNDLSTYCYSREIEPFKKALHNAICLHNFTELNEILTKNGMRGGVSTSLTQRTEITSAVKHILNTHVQSQDVEAKTLLESLERLQSLESLQSLERLQSLESLQSLERLDYQDVKIEPNSVVYCDIPYKSTNKYRIPFDYDRFYKWANEQDNIFISEYEMPDNFIELHSFKKHITMSANGKSHGKDEKMFTNQKTFEQMDCNNKVLW